MKTIKIRVGLDESGRGCLAGPVVVAAALIPSDFKKPASLPQLKDSKTMTRLQREKWQKWIKEKGKYFGVYITVSFIMPATIDKTNITKAANLAAWRSLQKLLALQKYTIAQIILDGGLFLKSRTFQESKDLSIKTIIKADTKFVEVQLAAISAKTARDDYMRRIATKYPGFGFEIHKGYGTKNHIKIIKKRGSIEGFHRQTFLKLQTINGKRLVANN